MKDTETIKNARVALLKNIANLIHRISVAGFNCNDSKKLYKALLDINGILKVYRYILNDNNFRYIDTRIIKSEIPLE